MVMPPPPRARLIVLHAQFALGFFNRRLHRPTQPTDPYQVLGRTGRGGIRQKDAERFGLVRAATKDRPRRGAGTATPRSGDAYKSKGRFNGAFAAFFDRVALPRLSRQSGGNLNERLGLGFALGEPRVLAGTAQSTLARHLDLGLADPHLGCSRHLGEIPFLPRLDTV